MHRISKPHGTVMVGITWGGGITRLQHVCHTGAQHSRRHATQHHISSIAVCVYAGRHDPEHARRCTSHMRTVCTLVSAWGGGLVRSNSIEMCLNLTARSTPTEHADGACRRGKLGACPFFRVTLVVECLCRHVSERARQYRLEWHLCRDALWLI